MIDIFIICLISSVFYMIIFKMNISNEGIVQKRKSYGDEILFLCVCSGLLILMTSNRMGYDAVAYKRFFTYYIWYGAVDYTYVVFSLVIDFFRTAIPTLTYEMFHFIILCILYAFVVNYILKKYAYCKTAVLALYLMSGVFAVEGMQFKYHIAALLVLYAVVLWCECDYNLKGVLLYYIICIMATLLHFSCAVFLLIPIIKIDVINRKLLYFPLVGLILFMLLYIGGNKILVNFLILISRLPFMGKLILYANSYVGRRALYPVAIYLIIWFLLLCVYKLNQRLDDRGLKVQKLVIDIWNFLGVLLPVLLYVNAAYRIYRTILFLTFLCIANGIVSLKRFGSNRVFLIFATVIGMIFIFCYPIALRQSSDIYLSLWKGDYFWIK
ncbi:MAG: EpsG family protein [Ruminococcus flavefaciens]|nr:EpsG family protein [Ruminococcus flavefaciens]